MGIEDHMRYFEVRKGVTWRNIQYAYYSKLDFPKYDAEELWSGVPIY